MELFKRKEMETGFVPNPEHDGDPRNLNYEDIAPLGADYELPESFMLDDSGWTLNQGKTSSCTCHASVHAVENVTDKELSARHAFSRIKTDPKYPSSTLPWGAYIRDAVLAVIEGVTDYKFVPNDGVTTSDEVYIKLESSPFVQQMAHRNKGGAYVYVGSKMPDHAERFKAIQRYLFEQKRPVLIGVDWRGSFNVARKGGIVPSVTPSGKNIGHAVLAMGWKYINGHLYMAFKNSYGSTWGDKGRVWLPLGFFRFGSAGIAYLPPEKTEQIGVVVPEKVAVERKLHLEKANAEALRDLIYEKFPLNVEKEAQNANLLARGLAGRNWLVLVPAITYRGWTMNDVVNWLYAHSRNKTSVKAYNLDFTGSK